MFKYFICFVFEDNMNGFMSNIFKFNYDILENNSALEKAKLDIAKRRFGDDRPITIINILPR